MQEDFGFGFEFEGASEDGNYYVDDVCEFNMLTAMLPIEKVGLSFSGEIEVDENTSVITDRQVEFENPEKTIQTYLKVMEIRDLTEDEIKHVSKFRLFFKKLFDVFFRGQKFRVFFTCFWALLTVFEVSTDDYFMALFYVAAIALYTSPIKFAKEMKKMLGSKKRKEELRDELTDLNIMGLVSSIPDNEGIQLYFKPKAPNM